MKQALLSAAAVAVLSGVLAFPATALGQTARPAAGGAAAAAKLPHQVGLIDMAYVFKNYKKFDELRLDLKSEIEGGEAKMKVMVEEIQQIQATMKTFVEGSDKFTAAEKMLAGKSAEAEAFRRSMQRDFLKKESQIYHTVYLEVSDAVKRYAEHFQYTLVIRFTREDLNTENPQELIQGMNRQVVYHRGDDDITLSVVEFLNRNYEKSSGGAGRPAPTTTNRPAPAGTAAPR